MTQNERGNPVSEWDALVRAISSDLPWTKNLNDVYQYFSSIYEIPYHLAFLITHRLESGRTISLDELASTSFYAVCRDISLPFRRRVAAFKKWFGLYYPDYDSTTVLDRVEWFLRNDNGISVLHKTLILDQSLAIGASGIGEGSLKRALGAIAVEATLEEIERRRQSEYNRSLPGSVASFITKERGSLTTSELMKTIDELKGDLRTNVRIRVLQSLLERMGKVEAYIFTQMVCKFRFHHSMGNYIAPILAKIYNVDRQTVIRATSMTTIQEVAQRLEEGKSFGLGAIVPLQTFKPMLASPPEETRNFPVIVEAKYDGVRLLIHKLGNQVAWITRNRNDFSRIHESLVPLARLFPFSGLILDGELVGTEWTGEVAKRVTVYDLLRDLHSDTQQYSYHYIIFDVLHLNGQDLSGMPLSQRRNIRSRIISLLPPNQLDINVEEVDSVDAYSPDEIVSAYNRYLEKGYEGAIIKEMNSPYRLGERVSYWKKMIPRETFDVVITGFSLDTHQQDPMVHGFRAGVLDAERNQIVDVSYISGLDKETGRSMLEILIESGLVPEDFMFQRMGYERRDSDHYGIAVHPGLVVTVDVMGIITDDVGNYTFRSPRFHGIQEHKPVEEIATYADLARAFERQNM